MDIDIHAGCFWRAVWDRAIAKEEAVREEYENAVFKLKQQNQRGMKELQTIQALSAFKQKLLSKINDTFLSRANEVPQYRVISVQIYSTNHVQYATHGYS